ncbi:glycosyltransferase family 92 protein [Tanacetum coccineum]
MDSSDQRRKPKPRFLKPSLTINLFSARSLLFFLSFFVFFFILLRPSFYTAVLLPESSVTSIYPRFSTRLFKIDARVVFPDHILVLLLSKHAGTEVGAGAGLECVYTCNDTDYSGDVREELRSVLSVDEYNDIRWLVRCPLPPANFSSVVTLRSRGASAVVDKAEGWLDSWENLAYEAVMDGNMVAVFVKGISHRQVGKVCIAESFEMHPEKAQGIQVTVSFQIPMPRRRNNRRVMVPSVAKISGLGLEVKRTKHELCVCTMLWNQADSISEWITYHSWLGVEKWFIYDNNSDDDIQEVIKKLDHDGYNVSRHVWPWIKTQEAGFSHCAIRARDECNWVSFMDVDEFYYFPRGGSLRTLVSNYTSSSSIGELRTSCHSFGPSGLRLEALDTTLMNVVHHFHLKKGFRYNNVHQGTAVINHYKYQVWESFRAKFYRRVATYVADWQDNHNEGSRDRAPGLGTEAIEPPDWRLRFCEVWDTGLKDFVLGNLADNSTGILPWDRSLGHTDIQQIQ